LFEFFMRDGENRAFDDVSRVAREFKIAMIGGAAAEDEVVILDADNPQAITNECVTCSVQFSFEGRELNR
jgi:hypothetical protein